MFNPITGVLSVLTLVLAALAFWQYEEANSEREARVQAQMQAAIAEQELEDTLEKQEEAQQFADEINNLRENFRNQSEDMINENNRLRAQFEQDLRLRPFSSGADLWVDLADIMCRIQDAGGDGGERSCGVSPSEARTTASPVVVVTPEEAETWAQICDDTGDPDFCHWAIAGFTTSAMVDLKNWMLRVEEFTNQCMATYDYYREVIDMEREESK